MRSPILTIGLVAPEPPEASNLDAEQSWLLRGVVQLPDRTVLAFLAPGITKDESLGRLFPELDPTDDGQFVIELGVILPDRLPTLEGQADFALEVPKEDGGSLQVCLSNQMTRLRYRISGDVYGHALCPRFALERALSEEPEEVPAQQVSQDAHIEHLPTVATCHFEILGSDAEDALEEHLDGCIDQFVVALNQIISAHLMLPGGQEMILNPTYARGSFDYFYLLIRGRDPNMIGGQRITPNAFRSGLNAPDYDEETSGRFLAFINGARQIDDVTRILQSATSYLKAGLNEFALLQLAIAAEIATSRFVHKLLEFAGVSKTKLRNMEKEMTFSRMLNVDVMALCPPSMKPDRNLLGSIDRLRDLRNSVMHRADFSAAADELHRLQGETEKYIRFLNDVLEHRGLR